MAIKNRYTPKKVGTLKPNEVFVFGSNEAGNHAGGAAKTAVAKFGAVMGQGEGLKAGVTYEVDGSGKFVEFR